MMRVVSTSSGEYLVINDQGHIVAKVDSHVEAWQIADQLDPRERHRRQARSMHAR